MTVDEGRHRGPEAQDQPALHHESQAPGKHRGQHENGQIDVRHAAGDGEHLVGDGGQASQEHGPEIPFAVKARHALEDLRREAGNIAEEKPGEHLPQPPADAVAKDATGHRAGGAKRGIAHGMPGLSQADGHEQHIRWDREKGGFSQRQKKQG